ncbi:hypothetical protein SLS60_007250 [Paraconiothyrium brasiliense]|uniref:Uncharacterized protein n=1 Tax=Paraconiothyrium brasiliense TaxID=300254 RepID=A0ABR3R956_9PLEO
MGQTALLTATPDVNSTENGIKFDAWFAKKLIKHFKKENLARTLPFLLSDAMSALEWISLSGGTRGGMFDPFEEMNRIVYRLTMRSIGVREISESPELLEESLHLVEAIDKNSSTARIIFPWLPTLKHGKRLVASIRFYFMIHRLVKNRKKTGRREDDMVQVLLDDGESTMKIVMVRIDPYLL